MVSVLLVGIAIAVGGLFLDSELVATAGLILAGISVFGFLLPGLRDVRPAQQVDRESYFGFVANLFRTTHGRGLGTLGSDRDKRPPSARDRCSSHRQSDKPGGSRSR
jgi:hypothetical protein